MGYRGDFDCTDRVGMASPPGSWRIAAGGAMSSGFFKQTGRVIREWISGIGIHEKRGAALPRHKWAGARRGRVGGLAECRGGQGDREGGGALG
jgi:hypothetical protein